MAVPDLASASIVNTPDLSTSTVDEDGTKAAAVQAARDAIAGDLEGKTHYDATYLKHLYSIANTQSPIQKVGEFIGKARDLSFNTQRDAILHPIESVEKLAEFVKPAVTTASEAVKNVTGIGESSLDHDYSQDTFSSKDQNLLSGATSFVGRLPSTASSVISGASNLINPWMADDVNAVNHIVQRATEQGIKDKDIFFGGDPNSPEAKSIENAGWFALPAGIETKVAPLIAKGVEAGFEKVLPKVGEAVSATARAGKTAAPTIAAATELAHGSPLSALGILISKYGGESLPGIGGTIGKVKQLLLEKPFDFVESAGNIAAGAKDGKTMIESWSGAVDSEIDRQAERLSLLKEKFPKDTEPAFENSRTGQRLNNADELSGKAKEARAIEQRILDLNNRKDTLNRYRSLNQILSDGAKFGLNVGLNTGVTGLTNTAITGPQGLPGQQEESAESGFKLGSIIGLTGAPFVSDKAMDHVRFTQAREKLGELGQHAIKPEDPDYLVHQAGFSTLTPEKQTEASALNGFASQVGGKVVFLTPEAMRSKYNVPEGTKTPPGSTDGNTVYINAEDFNSGHIAAGHEVGGHLTSKWFGEMLRNADPKLMDNFEQSYQKAIDKVSTGHKFSAQEERDAEVARVVLQDTPIEMFQGGESGKDIVKRVLGNAYRKIFGDKYQVDPYLDAPVSGQDRADIRARLFKTPNGKAESPKTEVPADTQPGNPDQPQSQGSQESVGSSSEKPTSPTTELSTKKDAGAPSVAPDAATGLTGAQNAIPDDVARALKKKGFTDEQIAKLDPKSIVGPKIGDLKITPEKSKLSSVEIKKEGDAQSAPKPEQTPSQPEVTSNPAPKSNPESAGDLHEVGLTAEQAVRDKYKDNKRKTQVKIDEEAAKAGLIAMAQAHAPTDPSSITYHQDRYGKESISGTKLNPNDPFHQHLISLSKLTPEQVNKVNKFGDNEGKLVGITSYGHAVAEGEATGASRKEEQKANSAQDRAEGKSEAQNAPLNIIPSRITFNTKSNVFTLHGFNPDKFFKNGEKLFSYPDSLASKAYEGVNDTKIPEDLAAYRENNENGFTGDGRKRIGPNTKLQIKGESGIVFGGTDTTTVKINPDYKPRIIPADRFQVINAMLGLPSPSAKTPRGLDLLELGKANAAYVNPGSKEFNIIRSKLGEEKDLLEPTTESLRPENIKGEISNEPVADEHLLRPSGVKPEQLKALGKSPRSDFAGVGFLPAPEHLKEVFTKNNLEFIGDKGGILWANDPLTKSTLAFKPNTTSEEVQKKVDESRAKFDIKFLPSAEPRAVKDPAFRFLDGSVVTGKGSHFVAMANANRDPRGSVAGWVTNEGEFLDRDQAEARGIEIGQITKEALVKAKKDTGDSQSGLESQSFKKAQGSKVKQIFKSLGDLRL